MMEIYLVFYVGVIFRFFGFLGYQYITQAV